MQDNSKHLCAYEIYPNQDMPISRAPTERAWMDVPGSAYRCLPLTIANQYGWMIHNAVGATVTWNGDMSLEGISIEFDAFPGAQDPRIRSMFGGGIVTFTLPYIFRTPPSVNLWVKGPTNYIKDGAHPLEGIVETDWLPATFTMNWKVVRPHDPVRFERGEPICMVVPVARGFLEQFEPIIAPLHTHAELSEQYRQWAISRAAFNAAVEAGISQALTLGWQKHYTRGLMPDGTSPAEHQTRLQLKEFVRLDRHPAG
jgi:hypothetical protein